MENKVLKYFKIHNKLAIYDNNGRINKLRRIKRIPNKYVYKGKKEL